MFLTTNTWSATYYVCEGNYTEDLAECVNEYLERGYKLHGSMVAVSKARGLQTLYQPMLCVKAKCQN
tara:strand:+ start:202 stop:402 length:201 start_codon:yes stop_codon:yes gene_type:complete